MLLRQCSTILDPVQVERLVASLDLLQTESLKAPEAPRDIVLKAMGLTVRPALKCFLLLITVFQLLFLHTVLTRAAAAERVASAERHPRQRA